jgi:hypothetical protein
MAIQAVGATPAVSNNAVQPARQAAPDKATLTAAKDTVTISSTAKNLQQRTAAPANTVHAAASGDLQAKSQVTKPAPNAFEKPASPVK